jgi:thymidine phosphorylase
VITDMNQPLAWTAGNALEVAEAISFLTGAPRHPRLEKVVLALGAQMMLLGGISADVAAADALLRSKLDNGEAAERFARMVARQGGPTDLLEAPALHLDAAPVIRPLLSPASGYVTYTDTRRIGNCVVSLGGGRSMVGDIIDARVGLSELCSVGDRVDTGQTLAMIHAGDDDSWQQAADQLGSAVHIGPEPVDALPIIYDASG